jgi:hypothetical protein
MELGYSNLGYAGRYMHAYVYAGTGRNLTYCTYCTNPTEYAGLQGLELREIYFLSARLKLKFK